MKTSRKFIIGCGSMIAIIFIAVVSLVAIVAFSQNKYDKIAVPFVNEMMPQLATWEYSNYKPFVAPEAIADTKEEEMVKLFGMFRRLGALLNFDKPSFQKISASTSNPYGKLIQYALSADFENGNARITLVLVPTEKEVLKVWYIQINSDAFIIPLENGKTTGQQNGTDG